MPQALCHAIFVPPVNSVTEAGRNYSDFAGEESNILIDGVICSQ